MTARKVGRRPAGASRESRPLARRLRPAQAKLVRTVGERAVAAIVAAEHGDPFAVLGPHEVAPGVWEVRAMLPEASAAAVDARRRRRRSPMEQRHDAGFFVASFEAPSRPNYRLSHRDRRPDGDARGRLPLRRLSHRRGHRRAARRRRRRGLPQARRADRDARVASRASTSPSGRPNARRVSVVGDFNDWDGRRHPMRLRHDGGVWELFVPRTRRRRRATSSRSRAPTAALLPARPTPSPSRPSARRRPPRSLHGAPAFAWRNDEWLTRRAGEGPAPRADLGLRVPPRLVGARAEEATAISPIASSPSS